MTTSPRSLATALEHFRAGRISEAEACLRMLVAAEPDHAEALNLLAAACQQRGELNEAIELIRRAVALSPQMVAAHSNLGTALNRRGQLAEAAASYRRAIDLKPEYAEAHYNLGIVLKRQGKLEEAVECYRQATRWKPRYAKAHNNLGNVLQELGRLDEAAACFRQVIELKPSHAEAHYNLGIAQLALRRLDEAVASFRRAVELKPSYAAAHYNLGLAFKQQGRFEQAVLSYREAIEHAPENASAHLNLGTALQSLGKLEEAIESFRRALERRTDFAEAHNNLGNAHQQRGELDVALGCYERAIAIRPDHAEAHHNLGITLREQGRMEPAETSFRRALEIRPDYVEAHHNLGDTLQESGRLEEAEASLRRTIELKPDYAQGHYNLSLLKKFSAGDVQIEQMEALLASECSSDEDRLFLHFALGKAYDDLQQYDRAFGHYSAGNRWKRQQIQYSAEAQARDVSELIAFFSVERFADWGDSLSVDSELPIFIVGMPRSGTTLVEQIVASHPDAFGAGELMHVTNLAHRMSATSVDAKPFPFCLEELAPGDARSAAAAHIAALQKTAPQARRIADKMPFNFFLLGLIALLWPRSRIVHCLRDPMAVGFSCYTRNFTGQQHFAWNLKEIGAYWREYDRLARHWKQVLPTPMLELSYENLVQHPEQQIRRLIDHCGLDWHDQCLAFHRTRRQVRTGTDVLRPIYKQALDKWRNYEQHLEPLKRALTGQP